MSELIVGIGLVFVMEGLFFAAFPSAARRNAIAILETSEQALRVIGVIAAAIGVGVIWLHRALS